MRMVLLLFSCCWLLAARADTSPSPSPAQPSILTTQPASSLLSQTVTDPVPVPEPSAQALAYYRSGNVLWGITTVWGMLIPAVFVFTGFSARIRTWTQRLGTQWFFVVCLYFVVFSLLTFVLDLPLEYYAGYVREHAYGLSNQTFGKWSGDALKELLVGLVLGVLSLWAPYLLLRKSPQRWWLYTGFLVIPFLVVVMLIQPIWIAPLFNHFGPMKNQALEARILHLAERAGIEGGRVFEVEKSEDTKRMNAYVTGLGATKRIVLWDTTIAKLTESELLFVLGHEMGHYVLGHLWKLLFCYSALIIATLYAVHRTAAWLITHYQHRFGFDQLADIASLPLLLLLFSLYSFLILPIALAYTRHLEHEADRFGLELTQNNHAAATAFVKLQTENLAIPRPGVLFTLWRASHPTLGERIDFCNRYRPWEQQEPLVYGDLFKDAR